MSITDDGVSPVCMTWTGYRNSDVLVTYSTCHPFVKIGNYGGGQDVIISIHSSVSNMPIM
jgi:hypothetical protein